MMGPEEKNLRKLLIRYHVSVLVAGKGLIIRKTTNTNEKRIHVDSRRVKWLFGEVLVMILSHFKRRPNHFQTHELGMQMSYSGIERLANSIKRDGFSCTYLVATFLKSSNNVPN